MCHEVLTQVVQTVELLDDVQQQLIKQAHVQQWIT